MRCASISRSAMFDALGVARIGQSQRPPQRLRPSAHRPGATAAPTVAAQIAAAEVRLDDATAKPPEIDLGCAHFGIGSPRLSLASDTYDNALRHEAADLLLMKYPG
jgi:hypothetical protein